MPSLNVKYEGSSNLECVEAWVTTLHAANNIKAKRKSLLDFFVVVQSTYIATVENVINPKDFKFNIFRYY